MMELNHIYCGDALEVLKTLPDNSVDCGVTSPPYFGLRDYGVSGQIGLEETSEQFIKKLVDVFRKFRRVLKPEGTLWVNVGDSYAGGGRGSGSGECKQKTNAGSLGFGPQKAPKGMKPKDLIGIPWMLAFALRADGWYLRQDIIWSKPNPMPESVTDRCTKSHEYIFLLSKSSKYYFDSEAIKEPSQYFGPDTGVGYGHGTDKENRNRKRIKGYKVPSGWDTGEGTHGTIHRTGRTTRYGGNKYSANPEQFYRTKSGNAYEPRDKRNKRSVWTVGTQAFKEAHFATFPEELMFHVSLPDARRAA